MERNALVVKLKQVSPALSTREVVKAFVCFQFLKGGGVQTYDDVVGIRTNGCDVGIVGGIRGQTLLDFLGASRAKKIEFEAEDSAVKVKAGRAKLELPLVSEQEFVFDFPDLKEAVQKIEITPSFRDCLKKVLISMGTDPSYTWRLGVTLDLRKGQPITLYSCNDTAVTMVTYGKKASVDFAVVMPPRFTELLTDLGEAQVLYFGEGWVRAEFEGLSLFSRTISEVQVAEFEKLLNDSVTDEMVNLPAGFDAGLEKAMSVMGNTLDAHTTFKVEEDKLYLHTQTKIGEVHDRYPFPGSPVTLKAPPAAIRKALPYTELLGFKDGRSVQLEGAHFLSLVSAVAGAGD